MTVTACMDKGYHIKQNTCDASFKMNRYHYHTWYEIYIVMDGQCTFSVYDTVYELKKGDVLLLKPGLFHFNNGMHAHTRIVLEVSDDYLNKHFSYSAKNKLVGCFDNEYISVTDEVLDRILYIFNNMKNNDYDFMAIGSILTELSVFCEQTEEYIKSNRHDRSLDKLNDITEYIADHFREVKTIGEIAKACYISESHMCRMFKNQLNVSVMEFVNAMRLGFACEQLLKSEVPVVEISASCGFHSSQYFSRIFKSRMGCTPIQYRKQKKSDV